MENKVLIGKIKDLEEKMWHAFATGNQEVFSELVLDDALMICGGFRESGREYAQMVSQVRLESFKISEFIATELHDEFCLTNYIVEVICPSPDLAGKYRVSSLWKMVGSKWMLTFNQDTRLLVGIQ